MKIWPVLAAIRPGHLKSIYLDNCIYMPSVLRRFFIDHSKTLEHVTMNRSYNLHGTFTWVFEEHEQGVRYQFSLYFSVRCGFPVLFLWFYPL